MKLRKTVSVEEPVDSGTLSYGSDILSSFDKCFVACKVSHQNSNIVDTDTLKYFLLKKESQKIFVAI